MFHIKRYLQKHPEAVKELGYVAVPPPPAPAHLPLSSPAASKWPMLARSRGARTAWRRGFYALVMIGLCGLLANVLQVHVLERNTHRAQVQVVEEVRQNRGWLTKVLVVQALLITFNVVITVRGVKVRARSKVGRDAPTICALAQLTPL
jgi:pimeloyl-ACP methyl ester carboxylesterase